MVAIHSVVAADDIWNLLPRIEEAGGTGILVLPIEQLVP
jgi:ATP phosphoribosyltransferase-like protein